METAYGILGISLLFVGIVLVINGVGRLCKIDGKSLAVMNLIAGFVIIVINLLKLDSVINNSVLIIDYVNVASGFLFGFTYIFIAANYLLKLDLRPFGWFSVFVAIYAIVMSVLAFTGGNSIFQTTDLVFGFLWAAWAILWLEGFLELVVKLKIGKIFPYLSILEGIFAAFVPAILMLLSVIKIVV